MIIMSAGPTSIAQNVRNALVKSFTNTDLDKEYIKFHHECENKVSKVLNTKSKTFLMLGEAMLGLDGACASFIEKGDRVLVLINGIFSEGFSDFVDMYDGIAYPLYFDLRHGIDIKKLEEFLEKDHDFKAATLVHCETPSGISNDISSICRLLNKYNILSIVDSVSGIGGEKINFDEGKIDCLIGGTQKCFSAPSGLTTITLSNKAITYLKNRKTKVYSFYGNFKNYLTSGEFEFPYTPSDNLVYALDEALNDVLKKDFSKIHENFSKATRYAVEEAGLEIYAKDYRANTVTTVLMPEKKSSLELLNIMQDKGIIISGGMGNLNDKAFRIGHMGNNISNMENYVEMLKTLNESLRQMGISIKKDLDASFLEHFNKL